MTAPDDCADIRIDLKTALPAQPVFLPTNAKNRLFSVLNTAFQAFQPISGMAPSAGAAASVSVTASHLSIACRSKSAAHPLAGPAW
jgi:hypothetical protein